MAEFHRTEQPLPQIPYAHPHAGELSIDGSCINSLTEEDIRDELSVQSGIIIKKIMSCNFALI